MYVCGPALLASLSGLFDSFIGFGLLSEHADGSDGSWVGGNYNVLNGEVYPVTEEEQPAFSTSSSQFFDGFIEVEFNY